MAEWSGRRDKKTCEDCEKLSNLSNFAKGVKARFAGVYDCANCDLMKAQPIWENENIVELYNALPNRFEGMTGIKYVTASDIKFILELYEIPRELWYDYYARLKLLCDEMVKTHTEKANKEVQAKAEIEKWKADKKKTLQKLGPGTEH